MKESITLTRTLKKCWEVFDKIDRIHSSLKHERKDGQFTVTFYHDSDFSLVATRWSDQHYDSDVDNVKKRIHSYCYSVSSRGIHFESYAQQDYSENIWGKYIKFWGGSDNCSIRLIDVPNNPPPNYKGSMYLFHQEKIRETMSALPAWAIAVIDY